MEISAVNRKNEVMWLGPTTRLELLSRFWLQLMLTAMVPFFFSRKKVTLDHASATVNSTVVSVVWILIQRNIYRKQSRDHDIYDLG